MGTDDFGVQSVHSVYKKAASLNQLCKGPISKLCLSVFHIQKAQMLPVVQQVSVTCAHRLFPFLVSMKYCLVTHHHPVAYPCCRELTLCRFLPTVSECLPFTHSDFFSNLSLYIRKDDFHLSLRGSQYLFVWGRQQRDYNTYTYPGHVPSSCMYTCIPQEQVTFSISSWLEKQFCLIRSHALLWLASTQETNSHELESHSAALIDFSLVHLECTVGTLNLEMTLLCSIEIPLKFWGLFNVQIFVFQQSQVYLLSALQKQEVRVTGA